ncbi:MAG: putative FKBP-type peptidyl-prolyl cis-trans isomerase FkpA [Chlamydiae bacterium]|nr:putative FKBP-type peptidyl-prolyl cis-trans isomerase FkpA [Chlamydiota bacterium]
MDIFKKTFFILALLASFSLAGEESPLPLPMEEISETLGHLIVQQLNQPGITFDYLKIVKGIEDELEGKPSPMSESEYEQAMLAVQESLHAQLAENNLVAANDFFASNCKKEGIESPDPKLQYEVVHGGEGEAVTEESIPLIRYKGSLLDGSVFATSEQAGENPVALPMQETIPGLAKGIVGMKEGEKRILYIHPDLTTGLGGQLPPNSLLIFEVEIAEANTHLLDGLAQMEKEEEIASPS